MATTSNTKSPPNRMTLLRKAATTRRARQWASTSSSSVPKEVDTVSSTSTEAASLSPDNVSTNSGSSSHKERVKSQLRKAMSSQPQIQTTTPTKTSPKKEVTNTPPPNKAAAAASPGSASTTSNLSREALRLKETMTQRRRRVMSQRKSTTTPQTNGTSSPVRPESSSMSNNKSEPPPPAAEAYSSPNSKQNQQSEAAAMRILNGTMTTFRRPLSPTTLNDAHKQPLKRTPEKLPSSPKPPSSPMRPSSPRSPFTTTTADGERPMSPATKPPIAPPPKPKVATNHKSSFFPSISMNHPTDVIIGNNGGAADDYREMPSVATLRASSDDDHKSSFPSNKEEKKWVLDVKSQVNPQDLNSESERAANPQDLNTEHDEIVQRLAMPSEQQPQSSSPPLLPRNNRYVSAISEPREEKTFEDQISEPSKKGNNNTVSTSSFPSWMTEQKFPDGVHDGKPMAISHQAPSDEGSFHQSLPKFPSWMTDKKFPTKVQNGKPLSSSSTTKQQQEEEPPLRNKSNFPSWMTDQKFPVGVHNGKPSWKTRGLMNEEILNSQDDVDEEEDAIVSSRYSPEKNRNVEAPDKGESPVGVTTPEKELVSQMVETWSGMSPQSTTPSPSNNNKVRPLLEKMWSEKAERGSPTPSWEDDDNDDVAQLEEEKSVESPKSDTVTPRAGVSKTKSSAVPATRPPRPTRSPPPAAPLQRTDFQVDQALHRALEEMGVKDEEETASGTSGADKKSLTQMAMDSVFAIDYHKLIAMELNPNPSGSFEDDDTTNSTSLSKDGPCTPADLPKELQKIMSEFPIEEEPADKPSIRTGGLHVDTQNLAPSPITASRSPAAVAPSPTTASRSPAAAAAPSPITASRSPMGEVAAPSPISGSRSPEGSNPIHGSTRSPPLPSPISGSRSPPLPSPISGSRSPAAAAAAAPSPISGSRTPIGVAAPSPITASRSPDNATSPISGSRSPLVSETKFPFYDTTPSPISGSRSPKNSAPVPRLAPSQRDKDYQRELARPRGPPSPEKRRQQQHVDSDEDIQKPTSGKLPSPGEGQQQQHGDNDGPGTPEEQLSSDAIERIRGMDVNASTEAQLGSDTGSSVLFGELSDTGSSVIFGDPTTFDAAAGEAPPVSARARAIEDWNGGLGMATPPGSFPSKEPYPDPYNLALPLDDSPSKIRAVWSPSSSEQGSVADRVNAFEQWPHRTSTPERSILRESSPKSEKKTVARVRFSDPPPGPQLTEDFDVFRVTDSDAVEANRSPKVGMERGFSNSLTEFDDRLNEWEDEAGDMYPGAGGDAGAEALEYWASSEDSTNFQDADEWMNKDPDFEPEMSDHGAGEDDWMGRDPDLNVNMLRADSPVSDTEEPDDRYSSFDAAPEGSENYGPPSEAVESNSEKAFKDTEGADAYEAVKLATPRTANQNFKQAFDPFSPEDGLEATFEFDGGNSFFSSEDDSFFNDPYAAMFVSSKNKGSSGQKNVAIPPPPGSDSRSRERRATTKNSEKDDPFEEPVAKFESGFGEKPGDLLEI